MDARILLKYSTSKCNKELLSFLHQNIDIIKQKFSLKVIVVYDNLIPKLGNGIKKLPVLIINGKPFTGNAEIRQHLVSDVGQSSIKGKAPKDMGSCDLEDYWNKEMHSGVDNDMNEGEELMETVKNRALEQSMNHRETSKPKQKRREAVVTSTRQDNIRLDKANGDKISDMVGGDPMMQKFWENQESTPGFE
jgi:hypothetical protein